MAEPRIYEGQGEDAIPDPDETPIKDRKLITQPYDLAITALSDQIDQGTLHLRPLSDRPKFQRRYVWPPRLASRLIESILLNVPIPPCYLAQDEAFELDVIDGQQRIYSIYRFLRNQFKLSHLEVLTEYNGRSFFELDRKHRRRLETYTLRCVIITNDSHPEIRFDVFERLNTNTIPLNAQELRNSLYRGTLNDLLVELAENATWLQILNRKAADKRMRGEELILRFFAFHILGVDSYRTPQKHWLNEAAKTGRHYDASQIDRLRSAWTGAIQKALVVFEPSECFRRLPLGEHRAVVNRALMDLTLLTVEARSIEQVQASAAKFRSRYVRILRNDEFDDLITRAVDHKSRTLRRFELWQRNVATAIT